MHSKPVLSLVWIRLWNPDAIVRIPERNIFSDFNLFFGDCFLKITLSIRGCRNCLTCFSESVSLWSCSLFTFDLSSLSQCTVSSDVRAVIVNFEFGFRNTVDSRYSVSMNSGKTRFSGFFQVTKTKIDFTKRILLWIADFSIFQ